MSLTDALNQIIFHTPIRCSQFLRIGVQGDTDRDADANTVGDGSGNDLGTPPPLSRQFMGARCLTLSRLTLSKPPDVDHATAMTIGGCDPHIQPSLWSTGRMAL